jgi:hypothetical protein
MLIERWERLRGYDQWTITTARYESAEFKQTGHLERNGDITYTYASEDELVWTDTSGSRHSASFAVPDDSPLYQNIGGESVEIRYDPARPDRYYYRELLQTRLATLRKRILWTLGLAVLLVLFGWVRSRFR